MKAFQTLRSHRSLLSFSAASLLAVTAAAAQVVGSTPGSTGIDASGNYQHEVQSCNTGKTQQDRATCLREARNAHAEKQRGTLAEPGQLQANAMARCDVFKDTESKAACEARVMGYGNASGSVAGGGVLREVETAVIPPGQTDVTVEPKTSGPVVLVPAEPSSLSSPSAPATQASPAPSQ